MPKVKREPLDLTDKELYFVALSIERNLNTRNCYYSKGNVRVLNKLIEKVCNNGMQRKNPEKILHPIMNFEDESK